MKRIALLSLLAVSLLPAETLTKSDRQFAMSNLHASRKLFLDSITGLSEAQWKFKPSPEVWSIAECAEHIALSEDALLQRITGQVLKTPPTPKPAGDPRERDQQVLKIVTNRDQKAQAPEFLKPSNKWANQSALAESFKQSREKTLAFIETTTEDLRAHSTPHPALKTMDAYQWVLLISAHSERHTAQINEVKTHPKYPK